MAAVERQFVERVRGLLADGNVAEQRRCRLRVRLRDDLVDALRALGLPVDISSVHWSDSSAISGENESRQWKLSLHLHIANLFVRQFSVDGAVLGRAMNCVMGRSCSCPAAEFRRAGRRRARRSPPPER